MNLEELPFTHRSYRFPSKCNYPHTPAACSTHSGWHELQCHFADIDTGFNRALSSSFNSVCSFVIPHPATSDRKKLALRRKVLIRFRSAVLLIVNRQRHMRVCLQCNARSKIV